MTPDQIAAIRDRHTRGRGAIEAWVPLEVVRSLEDVPALLDLLAEQVTATRAVMDDRDAARREERLRAEVLAATTSRLRGAEDALDAVRALHQPYDEADCVNLRHTNRDVGCPECYVACMGCQEVYPCPTIRAITPETTTTEGETP